jgi:putative peptidoglycan lipid II flippase
MEFPTALLGVALGVVLTPQLAAAKAAGDAQRIRPCSTGVCASWCCWPCPARWRCSPLPRPWWPRCSTTAPCSTAMWADRRGAGWLWGRLAGAGGHQGAGARLLRQPGHPHAGQDCHGGVGHHAVAQRGCWCRSWPTRGWRCRLAWALVNALWLLVGLLRRGSYRPQPGWARFALQVVAASALLAVLVAVGGAVFPWVEMRATAASVRVCWPW